MRAAALSGDGEVIPVVHDHEAGSKQVTFAPAETSGEGP
jgi:hypothetical protein